MEDFMFKLLTIWQRWQPEQWLSDSGSSFDSSEAWWQKWWSWPSVCFSTEEVSFTSCNCACSDGMVMPAIKQRKHNDRKSEVNFLKYGLLNFDAFILIFFFIDKNTQRRFHGILHIHPMNVTAQVASNAFCDVPLKHRFLYRKDTRYPARLKLRCG